MQCIVVFSLVAVLWVIYGYSLAFTENNALIGGGARLFGEGLNGAMAATFTKGVYIPELAFFVFPGGSGTVKANLDRQLAKFVEEGRKDKVEKTKIGEIEATYQDVNGTFKKKKFPMAPDFTPVEGYRQLYVVFEAKDGKQYYMTLLGPKATVEKHKKAFDEFLKNFK